MDTSPPPTTADIASLGAAIERFGFEAYQGEVAEFVGLARHAGSSLAALDVLEDPAATAVVRARAFAKLAACWVDIRENSVDRHGRFEESFQHLLSAWRAHDDLRQQPGWNKEQASSRTALDCQRLETACRYVTPPYSPDRL
jgi:hypothetical protein